MTRLAQMIRVAAVIAASVSVSLPALAQTSASFELHEYAFNAGGVPAQAAQPSSTGFTLSLASLGDSLTVDEMSAAGFSVSAGWISAFPPPGEVAPGCAIDSPCLVFDGENDMSWPAERSAGSYNLYRNGDSEAYGQCEQPGLSGPAATDTTTPLSGEVFFYLVTVANRLGEEGTKGFAQTGGTLTERGGAACP